MSIERQEKRDLVHGGPKSRPSGLMQSGTIEGYYCEHGYDIGLDDYLRAKCPHGCTETVSLCAGCGHEPHSSGHCVMSCSCEIEAVA